MLPNLYLRNREIVYLCNISIFYIIIRSIRQVYECGFAKCKTKEQRTASLDLMRGSIKY